MSKSFARLGTQPHNFVALLAPPIQYTWLHPIEGESCGWGWAAKRTGSHSNWVICQLISPYLNSLISEMGEGMYLHPRLLRTLSETTRMKHPPSIYRVARSQCSHIFISSKISVMQVAIISLMITNGFTASHDWEASCPWQVNLVIPVILLIALPSLFQTYSGFYELCSWSSYRNCFTFSKNRM